MKGGASLLEEEKEVKKQSTKKGKEQCQASRSYAKSNHIKKVVFVQYEYFL